MRKRILVIAAAIIVLLGLAFGAYYLLTNSAELTVSDNPFGDLGAGEYGQPLETGANAGEELAPRFIRITETPVAEGMVAIPRTSTTTVPGDTATSSPTETVLEETEIRFIDRASGNIYSFMAHDRSLTRISNKTLPGIQRASWLPGGSRAYVQFLSTADGSNAVSTYVLTEGGDDGFFLEQNLAQAEAVGSSTLFTLLSGTTGSVGSLANADGTGARTLFTSLLSSIIVHPTQGSFYAHTKASAFLDGYAFQINRANGAFSRIAGPFRGLSVLPSPDGTRLLYSYLDRGSIRLGVIDVATRSTTALPLATLIEKCTWSANSASVYCGVPTNLSAGLPDFWYQGVSIFSDRLWRLDMDSRLATLVVDPSAVADVSIDAVALTVDPAEDVLVFTDKHNGSLWMYDL